VEVRGLEPLSVDVIPGLLRAQHGEFISGLAAVTGARARPQSAEMSFSTH